MAETARDWLVENGYPEEARKIDLAIKKWKETGVKTRRNWWEVFAGGKTGSPKTIDGVEFAVIKSVRERMGLAPVSHAICKNKNESVPQIEKQIRWKGHKKKKRS